MASILIIEDDLDISELMSIQLKAQGHEVSTAINGLLATNLLNLKKFDLAIVDRMIPGKNGIELCKYIRSQSATKEMPILMVTALNQPENIIEGLDAGADDYITKPFDLNIFKARIRAQLRRSQMVDVLQVMEIEDLKIEFEKCRVLYLNEEVALTLTEFKILALLAKKPGLVFTRENLINNIQGDQVFVTNRTIDTHIAGLRKKIKNAGELIETIRGVGYRFRE